MLGFTRSFRALLWRNAIYRKRRWISSLIEFFVPALCVAILYFIKIDLESDPNSSLKSIVVPPSYPTADDVIIPLSFQDYSTALQAKRVCVPNPAASSFEKLLGIAPLVISGVQYTDWAVPFVFCNSYNCQYDGEDATDYCTYKTLALAPMNVGNTAGDGTSGAERMERFKNYVMMKYPQITNGTLLPFDYDFIKTFSSNDELQTYITSDNYGRFVDGEYFPKVAIGVVFADSADEKSYDYTIRVNSTNFNSEEQAAQPAAKTTPPTTRLFDVYKREDSDSCINTRSGVPDMGPYTESCTGQYILNGAVTIQRLVDDWILEDSGVTDVTVSRNGAVFLPFPSKEYLKSGFYQNIAPFAPLLFTLGLLYPISSTIRSIVLEKELRQKELMKMMSVTECDIGWSWFLSFYAFFCIPGVLSAIFTNLLYSSSSFLIIFIFWQLAFIACIVYCFFVAAISSKSTRATLIGIMLFFIGYFLPLIVNYETGNPGLIALVSLHPVTAYTYGLIMMGYLEGAGVGVQPSTISNSDFPSGYSFVSSLFMLAFDSIFWGLLTWYFNRILVGDYGTALPYRFPFTKQYWFPRKTSGEVLDNIDETTDIPIEPVSEAMKKHQSQENASVHIRNLQKQFGKKTAVDGLSLSMYSGQITALLGHNGAGKTTTIGMLTGMIPPTSGKATVAGYDIQTDLSLLREHVGVCLQHDCLFPLLTVKEHLQFFSRVKGLNSRLTPDDFEKSVLAAIEDVALSEKRNTFSKDLSGGMKRKLSVAIAFCGDPKVVFLDEPTSGMDPFSRRFTWNVIRQYRENRCIVLTTHFMDEADLLGDRIAIMAEGQLRCAGSSLYLKKHYGVGYNLTIIKRGAKHSNLRSVYDSDQLDDNMDYEENSSELKMHGSTTLSSDGNDLDDVLEKIVKGAVPSAEMLSNVGAELSFQLPIRESARFVSMFELLDRQVKYRKIESYGVSITTLDEVFLKVARGEEGVTMTPSDLKIESFEDEQKSYRFSTDSTNHFKRHVQALFSKRAKNFKRDKKAWCCSTILPTITTLFGFIVVRNASRRSPNYPSLTLSLEQNNPDVSVDRNPIPFNTPGVFDCQPGSCIYGGSPTYVNETSESYYFCGANVKIANDSNISFCSISDSNEIVSQISQYGAFGVGNDVSDVLNASKSVFDTSTAFQASQYGGIFFTHDDSSEISNGSLYDETVIAACEQNPGNYTNPDQCADFGGIGYIVNYNFTSLHSSLLYQALADEAILRYSLNDLAYKISASIWPLPITKEEQTYTLANDSFSAWFLLILSFPFIAGAFATFVVAERESKAKHLQTVAGVNAIAYWLSTYFWDIMNYQIPLWTIVALMYGLNVESFITNQRDVASATIALLVLFGPAAAGFTYLVSFPFKSPSMCNLFVIVFNFFIGMTGPIVCFILRLIAIDPASPKPQLKTAAVVIEWVLRLVPSFCLGRGLFFSINISFFELVESKPLTVWSPPIALYDVVFLAVESLVYILVTIQVDILSSKPSAVNAFRNLIQCICLSKKTVHVADNSNEDLDDRDVASENIRVKSGQADNELIILKDLTKRYPNGKLAVDHLSLGIPPGQCFGLLGINGAGKTTTMAMLTAEFPASSGDALLSGFSVSNEPEQTRRQIGYCPQFDAHFMNMTGKEHIELYAIIKGVPYNLVKDAVTAKLREVGLNEFDSNRLSSGYSGGMKRKLSVACATIGQPQIVFLDEPSTGMDPVARRDLWKVISRMINGRSNMAENEKPSVILTTHSMEECEALCPRIGIMAGGKLRCLGSAQHLKNRFGRGYQVEMKVKHASRSHDDFREIVSKVLEHLGLLTASDPENLDILLLASETFIHLDKVIELCHVVTGDDFLSKMISADDPNGYPVYKVADSLVGITADELVAFFTEELRLRRLMNFIVEEYPSAILRERQDAKLRFEISSEGVSISSVFAYIEAHKEQIMIDDYGVSQTSLEQVFNMHAAEAEKAKQNTVDGTRSKYDADKKVVVHSSSPIMN